MTGAKATSERMTVAEGGEGVQLRAAAHRVADRGAAAAAAHREAGQQPAGDVRGAEGEELLVGVDPLADALGERAGGEHVVGVGHHGDAEGGPDHRGDGGERQVGQARARDRVGHRSHRLDPERLEAEDGDGGRAEEHREERVRQAREEVGPEEEQDEQHRGEHERRHLELVEVAQDAPQLGRHRLALDVDAGEAVELADDHEHRDAGEVADEDGLGEQVGEEAEAEQPAEDAQHPGDDGQGGRQRGVGVSAAHADGGDRGWPSSAPSWTPGRPTAGARIRGPRRRASGRRPRAGPRPGGGRRSGRRP